MRQAGSVATALASAALLSAATPVRPPSEPSREVAPQPYTYAPGAFSPQYTPPEPGTYSLPAIQTVRDHALLDASGRETSLFALKGERAAIVAFVYTSCSEADGCPISMAVLHRLDRALAADRALGSRVSLITISFDPDRDTPERLSELRELHHPKADWRFATTDGASQLEPLLADFDQSAAKLRFPDGRWSGLIRHVLKVFLVDPQNRVRNIYSVGFLDADLLLADLRTLLGPPARR
jgi:cytochrome oxidase Cu insertion factor (SCO1/SenC/PrrC family)